MVDFRKLNEKSVAEPFYMPTCEEVIARLGPAKFLTKLDLAKGFHQIPPSFESLLPIHAAHSVIQIKTKV